MKAMNASESRSDSFRTLRAPFVRRLKALAALTPYEEHFIEALQLPARTVETGTHVYTEGDDVLIPWIVAAGWACRLRTLSDGRRQILGFLLPGDTIGICDIWHAAVRPTILAVTPLQLLNATKLIDVVERADGDLANIVRACHMQSVWLEAQLLDQVLRLGRLTALERMAHLLLELDYRMSDAGLAQDGKFPLPLTQSQFGDALGLSLVHVNRTLQQLRRDQLIELRPGRVSILDRERLRLLCDFRKPLI